MTTHRFLVKAGINANDCQIIMDDRELEGVTRVSFELSADGGPQTIMRLDILGEVTIEGEFQESALFKVGQPISDAMTEARERLEIRARSQLNKVAGELGAVVLAFGPDAEVIPPVSERVADLVKLVRDMIENDPDETIDDVGHTVLDHWRHDARRLLGIPPPKSEADVLDDLLRKAEQKTWSHEAGHVGAIPDADEARIIDSYDPDAWRDMAEAPRDGTIIEIKNSYGVAPWFGIFRWQDGSWADVRRPNHFVSNGSASLEWRSYTGSIADYVDPTRGAQDTNGYWVTAAQRATPPRTAELRWGEEIQGGQRVIIMSDLATAMEQVSAVSHPVPPGDWRSAEELRRDERRFIFGGRLGTAEEHGRAIGAPSKPPAPPADWHGTINGFPEEPWWRRLVKWIRGR